MLDGWFFCSGEPGRLRKTTHLREFLLREGCSNRDGLHQYTLELVRPGTGKIRERSTVTEEEKFFINTKLANVAGHIFDIALPLISSFVFAEGLWLQWVFKRGSLSFSWWNLEFFLFVIADLAQRGRALSLLLLHFCISTVLASFCALRTRLLPIALPAMVDAGKTTALTAPFPVL